jgi:Arc/MetJ-type ribon-helix-helix transcriptional regulator
MATTKVTVTLPQDQLEAIQRLVARGKASNVSQFVRHAVEVSLADVEGWSVMLRQALDQTGGPLTQAERVWADSVLGAGSKGRAKRRVA